MLARRARLKQVFFTKGGDITVADVPAPHCGPDELLVAVHWSVISAGTETKSLKLSPQARRARRVSLLKRGFEVLTEEGVDSLTRRVRNRDNLGSSPGYSAAGVVVAVGSDVAGFRVGERVACAGGGLAVHAEVIRVPPMLVVRVADEVPLREACWATMGAIALQGFRQAQVSFGETVVVIGLGVLGLLTVQIAKAAGCRVLGIDPQRARVDMAIAMGAEPEGAAGTEAQVRTALNALTDGIGADAVLLCASTASDDPARLALELVRQRGRVVVVGDVGLNLPRQPFYQKEAAVVMSCSYGPGRYDTSYEQGGIDYPPGFVRWTENRNLGAFVEALRAHQVRTEPIVTHTFAVHDAARAYQALTSPQTAAVGVLLEYPAATSPAPPAHTRTVQLSAKGPALDRVGVAVIGAGSFAMSTHLPLLQRHPRAALRCVVSRTGHSAVQAARSFGAERASTDVDSVLSDPTVQAVIVATRHDSHAGLAIRALQAGKHVLVEKPAGLTLDELDALARAAQESGKTLLVGHNRRFSPHARAVREALDHAHGAPVVLCRINAGPVPASHWTQDVKVGGGRIVGEGSHFLDLVTFLVGDADPVVSVQAVAVPAGSRGVPSLDNYTVSLRFASGALATVLYTSVGHASLAKERVEVFCGGNSFVIDDYLHLHAHGPSAEALSTKRQDKGHASQMDAFLAAVEGQPDAVPSVRVQLQAARLAVRVDRALRGGVAEADA
jgi:predicted dehydrogenase/threonine dehydrogenase-like Zn-dependent dehydrogenase